MPLHIKQVVYHRHGDPEQVLTLEEARIHPENMGDTAVLVRWIAAPVNPADLSHISAKYGAGRTSFPVVPGVEGCGVVEKIGPKVTSLRVGDLVVPIQPVGTWCTHGIHAASQLMTFGTDLPTTTLATILATPPTAYRLLKDFVELRRGDVIVQNGANSAVGKYFIQLAHLWGFKTINVVRSRPNIDELKAELKEFGADEVYAENEFKKLPANTRAKLALDCVGGESSLLLSSMLAPDGVLVNYGSMSGQPVQVSPRDLIFKNVQVRGFLLKNFYEKASVEDRTKTFAELVKMLKEGTLKTPRHTEHLLNNVIEAVKASRASTNSKQILCMSKDIPILDGHRHAQTFS